MFCPMTKEECRHDCALFIESRHKYKDQVVGKCSLRDMHNLTNEIRQMKDVINKLEQTIRTIEFTG